MSLAAPIPAKKLEILKLAFDRFYDGGFHATGIDTVIAASGISKRTLYKYFSSKEDLIEGVLDYYGKEIANAYFAIAEAGHDDARDQVLACFDSRRMMLEADRRGCLGIKASQEYAGKHEGIASRGERLGFHVERRFIDMCTRLPVADPASLGKQITVLFQGALLLSQVYRDAEPFETAKSAVMVLLDQAAPPALARRN
ncbi:TetR/AcrR family transcriptional regulator [Rhizobium sp. No.120]